MLQRRWRDLRREMTGGRRAMRNSLARYAAVRAIRRCHSPNDRVDRAVVVCALSCQSALLDIDSKCRATGDIRRDAEWIGVIRSLCSLVCQIDHTTTYEKFVSRLYVIHDLALLCKHPRAVAMRSEMQKCKATDWSTQRGRFAVFTHEVQELIEIQDDW